MKCVVPLAGPDLVHPVHEFRPWVPLGGLPLLERALGSRPWKGQLASSDHVFVLRETPQIERLEAWLRERWPGSRQVRLSHLTEGALYSALAGVAGLSGDDEPIVVDLADILFEDGPQDLEALFDGETGMVVPCFDSDEPCFSYLRSEDGRVVEAAEKRVISRAASAGVYVFRDRPTFLKAAAHSIANRETLAYRGVLFVCPMANGVIADGFDVLAPMLSAVDPIGKAFHDA